VRISKKLFTSLFLDTNYIAHKPFRQVKVEYSMENKEQAEALDRLEFGVPFQGEGLSPSNLEVYSNYSKAREGGLDFDYRGSPH